MKKHLKRILVSAAAVGAVLAVGLTTTSVVNGVASESESHRIEQYGQKVEVDGGAMNVLIAGAGPADIVLLPGFGTASPVLDFEPLVTDLAKDHRVIVVEPFGYGLSDGYNDSVYAEHAREQISLLSNKNSLTPTYLNEMAHIRTNFESARGTSFPADLPLLLFVESDNAKNPDWLGLHQRQASSVADGTVIPVLDEHYLHHSHTGEIADEFRSWEGDRTPISS
ncbi:alpha/beta fold hydrolase [Arthrobacter glacialis]|uniref:Alpha/beta hydrolase n=1 Tax=Arthrobacter glacialis TaxID=1664 RepID=A0A2S3ZVP4_ARTGL|nr:alpha/beta hydrolase [Arthrobacter glacialis]POH72947.1 hypothetical protein CVS27_12270 [Arthrobacter glacialis]